MSVEMQIQIQNSSSVSLSGSLPPLNQGQWKTPVQFPIQAGNIGTGLVTGDTGIKGSPGLVITAPGREGAININLQCLPVGGNGFEIAGGKVPIVGLDGSTTCIPGQGSPVRCNLTITDKK